MARMTLEGLWLSATKLSPWRRNYSQSPKRQINNIVPFVGTKTVLFTASFWGLTSKSVHLTNILFMNCEIIEEKKAEPAPVQTQEPTVIEDETQVKPPPKPYGAVVNAEPEYNSTTHFKVTYNGVNYWVKKIDMKKQPVLIRCSCEDYFFCWGYYNYMAGLQFGGRQRPYVRKTKHYPPKNLKGVLGLCKHQAQMGQMLQTSGYAL
jgi:hypothetical protein